MVAPLQTADGSIFAAGSARFLYRPSHELASDNRITIPVAIGGIETLAILDTAATYSLCAPDIAALLALEPQEGINNVRYTTKYGTINGSLHRLDLLLVAHEGQAVNVEAQVFVPDPGQGSFPSYVGLLGCLERLRFAVDMERELLYFSPF